MSAPVWVLALADAFWDGAGCRNTDLPAAISMALPLTPITLPRLRVGEIDAWLSKNNIPCVIRGRDRALHACLVAHTGCGAIFLDGDDSEDEQRFSLAHELAHFLRDYWEPRRIAAERFGPDVLDVFDRKRLLHPDEQIHALIAQVPIGFHVHLMERSEEGVIDDPAIVEAEYNADLLAFELLAPQEEVLTFLEDMPPDSRRERAENLLKEQYGLPLEPAGRYAALLVPERNQPRSLVHRLWPVHT
jgi:hypothetical protein